MLAIDLLFERIKKRQKEMIEKGQVPADFFDRPLQDDEIDAAQAQSKARVSQEPKDAQ